MEKSCLWSSIDTLAKLLGGVGAIGTRITMKVCSINGNFYYKINLKLAFIRLHLGKWKEEKWNHFRTVLLNRLKFLGKICYSGRGEKLPRPENILPFQNQANIEISIRKIYLTFAAKFNFSTFLKYIIKILANFTLIGEATWRPLISQNLNYIKLENFLKFAKKFESNLKRKENQLCCNKILLGFLKKKSAISPRSMLALISRRNESSVNPVKRSSDIANRRYIFSRLGYKMSVQG